MCSTPDRTVRVLDLARDIRSFFFEKTLYSHSALSPFTQVYKFLLVNLILGGGETAIRYKTWRKATSRLATWLLFTDFIVQCKEVLTFSTLHVIEQQNHMVLFVIPHKVLLI